MDLCDADSLGGKDRVGWSGNHLFPDEVTFVLLWKVDLSRFRAAPSSRLSHFPFESDGAFPAQC